ncbi:trypsin-like serine peptidase [Jiella pelagia]|uniref:Serine protease n=1 Tax=Jiella pelagia TaxID=2986949 RepID=A0ABY7C571_9HYPH|nr:serine protease [Jiella pelagia]WAP70901.1 serine protease [Jiella pelagia]
MEKVQDRIEAARRRIDSGRGRDLDTESRRLKAELRTQTMANMADALDMPLTAVRSLAAEAFVGARNNILSGEFLEIGLLAARSVCRITRGIETGTGFLVGAGVVVTNAHVLRNPGQARQATFDFLFDDNTIGTPQNTVVYAADPARFWFVDEALDVAMVALHEAEHFPDLSVFGWLPLLRDEGKVLISEPVNIIQHPMGRSKRITVHESTLIYLENESSVDDFCWYTGDTEKGSSGSPVLNSGWEVIAIHHEAVPATDRNGNILDIDGKRISSSRRNDPSLRIKWIANEGIRISRIVCALEKADLDESLAKVRKALLKLWAQPMASRLGWLSSLAGSQS